MERIDKVNLTKRRRCLKKPAYQCNSDCPLFGAGREELRVVAHNRSKWETGGTRSGLENPMLIKENDGIYLDTMRALCTGEPSRFQLFSDFIHRHARSIRFLKNNHNE